MRRTPILVVTDYLHVPPEIYRLHHEVTLCADIIFINTILYLTSISRNIHFVMAQKLGNRSTKNILK
eukprot:4571787-Ditylum_brightwellii.AAC.1